MRSVPELKPNHLEALGLIVIVLGVASLAGAAWLLAGWAAALSVSGAALILGGLAAVRAAAALDSEPKGGAP